jgi:hypothetical protein
MACSRPEANRDADLPPLPEAVSGYEPHVVRLRLDLGEGRVRDCHAGRIAPGWLLTSAHCFSIAAPGAVGTLPDVPTLFTTRAVRFHPGALTSGRETHVARFEPEAVRAAHDLALVAFDDPNGEDALDLWRPAVAEQSCFDARGLRGSVVFYGRDASGGAETAAAIALALAQPKDLLGPGTGGAGELLLAATGRGVQKGDSGSIVSSSRSWMRLTGEDCDRGSFPSEPVVLGVIQNAHPSDPSAPFGIVPTFLPEHYRWLDAQLTMPTGRAEADAGTPEP